MPTVSLVLIGDEILSGKFADENGPHAIARLRAIGADLRRLTVITDHVDDIAATIATQAAAYDFVITSGGVGPTHDDRTLQGIGQAFDLPLVIEPTLLKLLRDYGLEENEASLRMVRVPEGSTLMATKKGFPVLQVRNVFVLPGVPRLFAKKFKVIEPMLAGVVVNTARIRTDQPETVIAARLTAVAASERLVQIGSYPRNDDGRYVIITLESRDSGALARAKTQLLELIEDGRLLDDGT